MNNSKTPLISNLNKMILFYPMVTSCPDLVSTSLFVLRLCWLFQSHVILGDDVTSSGSNKVVSNFIVPLQATAVQLWWTQPLLPWSFKYLFVSHYCHLCINSLIFTTLLLLFRLLGYLELTSFLSCINWK